MPVILETISQILKNVNVGVDGLIIGYGIRFVYSVVYSLWSLPTSVLYFLWLNNFTCFEASYTFASFVIIFMRAWQ